MILWLGILHRNRNRLTAFLPVPRSTALLVLSFIPALLLPGLLTLPGLRDAIMFLLVGNRSVSLIPTNLYVEAAWLPLLAICAIIYAVVVFVMLEVYCFRFANAMQVSSAVPVVSLSPDAPPAAPAVPDPTPSPVVAPQLIDDTSTLGMSMLLRIVLRYPPQEANAECLLYGYEERCRIGKSAEHADFVVNDEYLSQRHCEIFYEQDLGWQITRLSQGRDMQVDRKPLEYQVSIPLTPGSYLSMGHSLFICEIVDDKADAAPDPTILPMSLLAMLIPVDRAGRQNGLIFPLDLKTRIGRNHAENDLILRSRTVSREHAVIVYDHQSEHFVIHNFSEHGLLLDSHKITSSAILHTDQILQFGDQRYRFVLEEQSDEEPAANENTD